MARHPRSAARRNPSGPASSVRKVKDGGGASGEAEVVLAIAKKTRTLLLSPRLSSRHDPHRPCLPLWHRRQRRPRPVLQPPEGEAHAPHPRGRLCPVRPAVAYRRSTPRSTAVGRTTSTSRASAPRAPSRAQPWRRRGALEPRSRPPCRSDRLQLGERPFDSRRDRVHDEPGRAAAPPVERLPVESGPRPHRREWPPLLRRLRASPHSPPPPAGPRSCTDRLRSPRPCRHGLGLVDRRLGRLELLWSSATTRDSASFDFSASACGSGTIGADTRRLSARYAAAPATTAPPSKRASRPCTKPMLQCRPAPASPSPPRSRAATPQARSTSRPKEARGNMIDYEILLLFDAELPDERQTEIVTRTRELVERGGGTFERHDVWGRRKLAYEIDHKPEGSYHLLTFQAEPGTLDEIRACSRSPTASCVTSPSSGRSPARPPRGRRRAPTASPSTLSPHSIHEERNRDGEHQPGRPRRQSDQGSRAPAHAERHRGLQPAGCGQLAPEGCLDRRVDREAELLRRHRVGQAGRGLRAVPEQGPARRHRRATRLARVGGPGRDEAPGGPDHREHRAIPRKPRRRRGWRRAPVRARGRDSRRRHGRLRNGRRHPLLPQRSKWHAAATETRRSDRAGAGVSR